jgi:Ser-tRNA(Ala) deacylase AlaX
MKAAKENTDLTQLFGAVEKLNADLKVLAALDEEDRILVVAQKTLVQITSLLLTMEEEEDEMEFEEEIHKRKREKDENETLNRTKKSKTSNKKGAKNGKKSSRETKEGSEAAKMQKKKSKLVKIILDSSTPIEEFENYEKKNYLFVDMRRISRLQPW